MGRENRILGLGEAVNLLAGPRISYPLEFCYSAILLSWVPFPHIVPNTFNFVFDYLCSPGYPRSAEVQKCRMFGDMVFCILGHRLEPKTSTIDACFFASVHCPFPAPID